VEGEAFLSCVAFLAVVRILCIVLHVWSTSRTHSIAVEVEVKSDERTSPACIHTTSKSSLSSAATSSLNHFYCMLRRGKVHPDALVETSTTSSRSHHPPTITHFTSLYLHLHLTTTTVLFRTLSRVQNFTLRSLSPSSTQSAPCIQNNRVTLQDRPEFSISRFFHQRKGVLPHIPLRHTSGTVARID
jgi:hypothetical protein